MSNQENQVQTSNAIMHDADTNVVGDGDPETDGRALFGRGVDVLDAILNSEDFAKPVISEWEWKRKGVALPIRALTNEEFRSINKRNTKRLQVKGSNQIVTDLDSEGYNNDIISQCLINPALTDPDIRRRIAAKAGKPDRNTISDVVGHLFLPGEVTNLAMAIIEISGFNDNEEETVQTLKG